MADSQDLLRDPEGPHNQQPSLQNRCLVIGRLLNGEGACTVVLMRDSTQHGWVLYPYGVAAMGIRISGPDARTLARHVLDGPN